MSALTIKDFIRTAIAVTGKETFDALSPIEQDRLVFAAGQVGANPRVSSSAVQSAWLTQFDGKNRRLLQDNERTGHLFREMEGDELTAFTEWLRAARITLHGAAISAIVDRT